MRSLRLAPPADPELVRIVEVPETRAPRGDELLVRVRASSINGTDLGITRGAIPVITRIRPAFPLGFDLAGVVVACGPAVTGFEVGDAICALIGHAGGAQSELVLVRQQRAARVPTTVPLLTAAALPLAGLTALQALSGGARLRTRARPRVLILGGSGGIGAIAIQLAKLAGARVTASTTGATREFVRDLGADDVLDRTREDALRPGAGWDVVFDTPGRVRMKAASPALGPHGVLVSTRGVSPDALRSRFRQTDGKAFVSVRTAARSTDLAYLLQLVADQRLRVPVQQVFSLDAAAEAYRAAESGVRGKIVIELGSVPGPDRDGPPA